MPHDFLLSSETNPNGKVVFYATLAGTNDPKFLIGYKVHYKDFIGLSNLNKTIVYDPANYKIDHDFWAYFIYPTALAESKGYFTCLNTYDRAKFTFGFMQYAAHVPNGDFVKFFKRLLELPNATVYFPKLELKGNNIFYKYPNGTSKQLEDNNSTTELMNYLNPTLSDVENQELICSARFVHWATNDSLHIKVQVDTAVEHFKSNMIEYHKRFGLQDMPDYVCQVICDIRHQGRSNNDQIAIALKTNGNYDLAYKNLLSLGSEIFPSRISTLESTINQLKSTGIFNKKYDSTTNSFK